MIKLAFSPNGKKLFHSTKKEVLVWSLESRKILYKCPGSLFAISDDSQTFLTKAADNTFEAWGGETGNPLKLEAINPNTYGRYKRSEVSADRKNRLLIIQDALNIYSPITIDFSQKMDALDHWVLSPDGEVIAIAYYVDIAGHDMASGECIGIDGKVRFKFAVNRFTSVPLLYFTEHRPWLAVESHQKKITLYDLTNGKPIQEFHCQSSGSNFFHIGGPASNRIAVIHYSLDSFQLKSDQIDRIITEPAGVLDVAFAPDGNYIASVLKSQESQLFLPNGRSVKVLKGEEIRLYNLATFELEDVLSC